MQRRFGWLWKPNLYAGMLCALLLGRAFPESVAGPLGISFYAAVRGAGFSSFAALPVGVAVEAGALSVMAPSRALWIGVAILVAHLGATAFGIGAKGSSPLGAAAVAGLATLVPAFMVPAASPVAQAFSVGAAVVLAPVFTLGILDVAAGSLFRGAVTDSPVPLAVMIAGALCGLDRLLLWSALPLQDVAAGLVVLVFAYVGGASLGAAAGAVLGISFMLSGLSGALFDVPPEAHSMAYVVAGLLAGTFRDLSKVGVGLAFYLGFLSFLAVTAQNAKGLLAVMYGGAAATALFLVIPRRWMARMPVALLSSIPLGARAGEEGTAGDALTVADRVRGLSRVLREVSRAFLHVATVEAPEEQDTTPAFSQVTERVCRSCSLHRQCWESEFHRTYQVMSDLWSQVDAEGAVDVQPPPPQLERFCIYPAEVASTLNYLYDLHRFRLQWEQRLVEGQTVAGDYVKNAARILERYAEETGREHEGSGAASFQVVSGVARLPKRGSRVSGDSYVSALLGEHRYLMALSDGMGVGSGAAAASKQCIQLLQEVVGAGFNTELAVQTVNAVFLLRSREESFVTLDLSLVDLSTGRVEFVKIGAAPSFIKRGANVTAVKQAAVPVGIIDQVTVEPEFRLLRPGDLIIMLTDGIWDVSKDDVDKERWILGHLARESSTDPEEIAESLLARALELMPDAGDDMTVLVARVDPSGWKAAEVKRPVSESWAPARRAPRLSEKRSKRQKKK